jgi:hypothetical protein
VAIWLRDSPLSEYIRREVLLDVSFTAVNFCALDRETGRLMMIDLTECNDGFQPIADPPTDAVIWVPQYTGQTTRPY